MSKISSDSVIDVSFFSRDLLFYLATSLVPFVVGALRIPIFSRVFSPHEYGLYAVATTTGQLVAAVLFAWVSNVQWRFYVEYRQKRALGVFYRRLFSLLVASGGVAVAVIVGVAMLVVNKYMQALLLFSVLQVFVSQLLSVCLVAIRVEGLSLLYMVVSTLRVSLTFGLMLVLVFVCYLRIETFFVSVIIVDTMALVACVFIVRWYLAREKLGENRPGPRRTRDFLRFGSWATVVNICLLALSVSDRYIITMFCPASDTGTYHQVYTICQVSVVAIAGAFMSVVNPFVHEQYTLRQGEMSDGVIARVRLFLGLLLPLVVIGGIFQREICHALLGARFSGGASIIFPVMLGSFFMVFAGFFETSLSYKSRMPFVALAYGVAAVANILANILLIPWLGYKVAAYTTLGSSALLFVMLAFPVLRAKWKQVFGVRAWQVAACAGCVAIHLLVKRLACGHGELVSLVEASFYYVVFVSLQLLMYSRKNDIPV